MTPGAGRGERFDDAAARARIRTSLGESLLVEASAGTGKTSELVRRIVAVLASGASIDKIVAVTFTHKAAGELKLRLRQELDRARDNAGDRLTERNLEDSLARLEEASIGTIHAFCAQLLRERPVEARVDPAFAEISEQEASRLFERAFRGWMESRLAASSPGLRRALARLAWHDAWDARSPVEQLQFAGRTVVEWRDHAAPWRREPFDREAEIDSLTAKVAESKRRLSAAFRAVHEVALWIERSEEAGRRDYDTLEALLLRLDRELKKMRKKAPPELAGPLELFRQRAGADLAAELREEMLEMVERYDSLKRRTGKLDFLDLLLVARDLVRDNRDVRAHLQRRFTHIFVDEFQDTDPLQAEILLLLASNDPDCADWLEASPEPGKLFLVGDPKQSIYKFRRADVVLYQAIRERLVERGVGLVFLTRSFRAVRSIQECVNAAFEQEMEGDALTGQARYAPLEEHTQDHAGQPAVVALPVPKPYGMQRISKQAINQSLPEAVVAFVAWLIHESGWTVRAPEAGGERMPVSARHVCVLLRRFTQWGEDVTRGYTRSLEARGIPHLLVGSKSFHHREEVETLRAALTAVEWPNDELSVFAALRGPLFAIPDAALLRFRDEHGSLNPFAPRPENLEGEMAPVVEVLDMLAELHRRRNWRPVVETVNLLLGAARAHAGFALRPAGNQVLANVYRVADLARTYESSGGISFRGFVEDLAAQAERTEAAEAPVLEEGADGVRIMTVHAAKGLEFPVIILADITANLAALEAERYVEGEKGLCATRLLRCSPVELVEHEREEHAREMAEGVRVAYVAATRARDLLVVPAVGDEEFDGWVSPLNKSLYPRPEVRRKSEPAPGCPEFGMSSVVERPSEYWNQDDFSVKPGLHEPRVGNHRVVWWDPSRLKLGVDGEPGLRMEEVLAADGGAARSLEAHAAWRADRDRLIESASAPRFEVFVATEGLELPESFECPVELAMLDRPAGRPFGPRFGTLVHSLLRSADLSAGREGLQAAAHVHARMHGAGEAEIEAALDAAGRALGHDLVRRARAAERVHREWPVVLKLDEKRVVEGSVDLAFLENGAWNIVDFKTDAEFPARAKRYQIQVQWYALALHRITALPVRAYLLSC